MVFRDNKRLIGYFPGLCFFSRCAAFSRVSGIASFLFFFQALFFVTSTTAETLTITGSGNPYHVLNALAKAFNSRQSEHTVLIPASTGTAGAIRDVVAGTTSLGRVGRSLTADERAKGLEYVPLGRDPVVFVGGANVTATTISREQAIGILEGRIVNWQELGGQTGAIRAIGREVGDASLLALIQGVPAFEHLVYGANVKIAHLDPQLLDLLDRYPNSFGFLNRSGLLTAKTQLVLLDFESIAPSQENLASGRYPFWTELGLIYKKSCLSDAGQAFVKFVGSADGLRILRENGVVRVADRK